MTRVAVVTGGSRGIGAAISKALKAAGYTVAANYAGNDEAAAKFREETGIPVYKWDVSSYDACAAGLAQIEKDLGPVDVQQAVRAAGGERGGLGRVDNVVRHTGDLGREGGHGNKTLERMDAHGKGTRSKAGVPAG